MKKKITIIKGDGIGPEIVNQALKVIDSIAFRYNHTFDLKEVAMGACSIDKTGEPITDQALAICLESDAVL